MLSLWSFGKIIERKFGPKTLLSLYVTGSIFGAAVILKTERYHQNQNILYQPSYHLGASGAVCSCIIYQILNFPDQLMNFNGFEVPAWMAGIIMVASEALMKKKIGIVSHSGHFGGLLAGIFIFGKHCSQRRKYF